jgi:hypothetical protein
MAAAATMLLFPEKTKQRANQANANVFRGQAMTTNTYSNDASCPGSTGYHKGTRMVSQAASWSRNQCHSPEKPTPTHLPCLLLWI